MKKINICLATALTHLYHLENKLVIVTDVIRATSSMVTAFANGVEKIIPVASIEKCKKLKQAGYWIAGEREGKKIAGFDIDNSPFSYKNNQFQGKAIAMNTTNGTKAIVQAATAKEVIIGAFLNLNAIVQYSLQQPNDVVILCAGHQDNVNIEDTLFAGALIDKMKNQVCLADDAAWIAHGLYQAVQDNLLAYVKNSPLYQFKTSQEGDVAFCLQQSKYAVVPVFKDGIIRI